MASLKRQTVTRPLPTDAVIFTRKGKQFAKWTDRRGKQRTASLTADGMRIVTLAATWTAQYRDGDGVLQMVATGCRDRTAAQTKLTELLTTADKIRAGSLTVIRHFKRGHLSALQKGPANACIG